MIDEWAAKWGVSCEAVRDLLSELTVPVSGDEMRGKSESAVQTRLRLLASELGWRLWRNNVGAYTDQERRTHIRYGLCNESKAVNSRFKSSDLIGVRPLVIEPRHIGTTVGQFVAIEVKKGSWRPGSDKREHAQGAFIELVRQLGGCAAFSNGELPE